VPRNFRRVTPLSRGSCGAFAELSPMHRKVCSRKMLSTQVARRELEVSYSLLVSDRGRLISSRCPRISGPASTSGPGSVWSDNHAPTLRARAQCSRCSRRASRGTPCLRRVHSWAAQTPNPRFDLTRSGGLRPPTRAGQPQRLTSPLQMSTDRLGLRTFGSCSRSGYP
jgi:hypothetical protein